MPSEFVEIHAAGTLLFITGLALAVELFILLVVPRIVAKLNPEKVAAMQELTAVNEKIRILRVESNKVNTPGSFPKYARLQRQLSTEIKKQEQLKSTVDAGPWFSLENLTKTARTALALNAIRVLLVVVVLLAFGRRTPLFELRGVSAPSSSSGVLSPVVWLLWRGPMTLLQGPVGVVVWTVMSQRAIRAVLPNTKLM